MTASHRVVLSVGGTGYEVLVPVSTLARLPGIGRSVRVYTRLHVRDDVKRTWARETRLERQQKGLEGTTPQLTGKYTPTRS